jgi:hypothetical protein
MRTGLCKMMKVDWCIQILVTTTSSTPFMEETMQSNTIVHGDCVAGMHALEPGTVDLVFADPPFNIGYK